MAEHFDVACIPDVSYVNTGTDWNSKTQEFVDERSSQELGHKYTLDMYIPKKVEHKCIGRRHVVKAIPSAVRCDLSHLNDSALRTGSPNDYQAIPIAQGTDQIFYPGIPVKEQVPGNEEYILHHPSAQSIFGAADLYNWPRNRDGTKVVVFVHGGGWRRGDKQAWRHYVSDCDTNLPMALFTWYSGLYGNVGRALARKGIACAVISYPLIKLRPPFLVVELFTSAVASTLLCAVLLALSSLCMRCLAALVTLVPICPNNPLLMLADNFSCELVDSFETVLMNSQMMIWFVICIFRHQYRHLTMRAIRLITALLVAVYFDLALPVCAWTSAVMVLGLVQGAIIFSQVLASGTTSITRQIQTILKATEFVSVMGAATEAYDPKELYLMGHSAGAHLVAMATLDLKKQSQNFQMDMIKGVVCLSGVFDVAYMDGFPFLRYLYLRPVFGEEAASWTEHSPLVRVQTQDSQLCGVDSCRKYICDSLSSGSDGSVSSHLLTHNCQCLRMTPFMLISTGTEPGPLQQQAVQFSKALKMHGASVKTITVSTKNHFNIVNSFESCYVDCARTVTLVDLCAQFIEAH